MNYSRIKILLFFVILAGVSCSNDENCVWSYKCCEFKEKNGKVSCVKMCEPEINCQGPEEDSNGNEVEVFEENTEQNSPYSIRGACTRGFNFYNGRCRRVLGKARSNV